MSTDVKIIGTNEKGEPTKLHITELAYLDERGKTTLEVSSIVNEIPTRRSICVKIGGWR